MGKIYKLMLCIALLISLCSCMGDLPPAYDMTSFLDSFTAMDYQAMYTHVSPAVDINKDAFFKKYDDIMSGLGVTEIVIDDVSEPNENGVFTYTATYKTTDYGDFTNTYTAPTSFIDDQCVVMWDYSLIFPEMEDGSSVRIKTLKAARGEMFAADGTVLAKNTYADTVYMNPSKVENIEDVTDVVGGMTGKSNTEIIDLFNKAIEEETGVVVLGAFFPDALTDEQKDAVLSVPGLGIDDAQYTPIRYYDMCDAAAHIIGYMGYTDEESLPEGYSVSDKLGLAGLEASYEPELRGSDGKIIYIEDRWGKNIHTLYEVPMAEGQDLYLTIKPLLQQKAYDALKDNLSSDMKGVVIVMDASTGYVDAMVSYPSFDNNVFTFSLSDETWEELNDPENNQPLVSRATDGRYPPGSVIKPFIAAVALEENAITPDIEFTGEIIDKKWTPDEEGWPGGSITRIEDSDPPLKLDNALLHSDNIYFAFAALRLGDEKLIDYLERIGMTEAVPFDLPVKKANTLNGPSYMTRKMLADMGYGQGQLLVTPIQMAAMYTAFANGTGDMIEPVLVQKLCRADGLEYNTVSEKEPSVWISDAVSGSSLGTLTPMLEAVVSTGTGHGARVSGVDIAGKTGTAEIDKTREISWFAGYWLNGYYDRLVIVMVDVAAGEGQVKFDIAKTLLSP